MIRSTLSTIAILVTVSCGLHAQETSQSLAEPQEVRKLTPDQRFVKTLESFEALKRAALTELGLEELVALNAEFRKQVTRLQACSAVKPESKDGDEPQRIVPRQATIGKASIQPRESVKGSSAPSTGDLQDAIAATLKTHQPTIKLRDADDLQASKMATLPEDKLQQLCRDLSKSSEGLTSWLGKQKTMLGPQFTAMKRQLALIERTLRAMTHRDTCGSSKDPSPPK